MGYVLPVKPLQSEQYANRMLIESYNFAPVRSVFPVKLSDFLEEHESDDYPMDEKKSDGKRESSPESSLTPPYPAYIPPNPANLSPVIARIVGKGMSVNNYI